MGNVPPPGFWGPGHPRHTVRPSRLFACESLSQGFRVEPPPNQNVCVHSSVLPQRPLLPRMPSWTLLGPTLPSVVEGEGWETRRFLPTSRSRGHVPGKPLETQLCGQSGGASAESAAGLPPPPTPGCAWPWAEPGLKGRRAEGTEAEPPAWRWRPHIRAASPTPPPLPGQQTTKKR